MDKKYDELKNMNEKSREILKKKCNEIVDRLKYTDFDKFIKMMNSIPVGLKVTSRPDWV